MSLISLVPIIASFLVLNGKPLSSRNSVWVTCVVLPCLRVLCLAHSGRFLSGRRSSAVSYHVEPADGQWTEVDGLTTD